MKKIAALATLAGVLAASAASAHGSHTYSTGTVHTPSHATTYGTTYGSTYSAPTVNLGPIEYVQPSSTVQYVQPATTTTYSTPTYTTPSYVAPSYTAQTYSAPSYTAPTYTVPRYTTPTYTAPSYSYTPSYTVPSYTKPAYVAPRYDATTRVQARLDRQRSRIRNANDRGDLRRGERKRLRRAMRDIREQFRAFRANDGIIDAGEFAVLKTRLDRQSQRIRRLANNHRVAGPLVSPYGHHHTRY